MKAFHHTFLIALFVLNVLQASSFGFEEVYIPLGNKIVLDCGNDSHHGDKWEHDGKLLYSEWNRLATHLKKSTRLANNYSLIIDSTLLYNEGVYKCSQHSAVVRTYSLNVEVQPSIEVTINGNNATGIVIIDDSEDNIARCYARKTKPAINMTWEIDNDKVKSLTMECGVFNSSKTDQLFNCETSLLIESSSTSGTLTCITSPSHSFGSLNTSIIFYKKELKGGEIDATTMQRLNEEHSVDKPVKWPLVFTSLPILLILGIGIYSCKKKYKLKSLAQQVYDNDCASTGQKRSSINSGNVTLKQKLNGDGFYACWLATLSSKNLTFVAKSMGEDTQLKHLPLFEAIAKTAQEFPKHPNIAEILGISVVKVPYYIYQEFIERGTLRQYLLQTYQSCRYSQHEGNINRRDCKSGNNQSKILDHFAFDIVEGMVFLENQKFCHPALSADKVLLHSSGACKLYDFWPLESAKVRTERILSKPSLIAWLAPETVFLGQYSHESDVWSFAVVLWELYSLGDIPYQGMTNEEVETALRTSCPLKKPLNCRGGTFDLMLSAWNLSVKDRPTFQELRNSFSTMSFSSKLIEGYYGNLPFELKTVRHTYFTLDTVEED